MKTIKQLLKFAIGISKSLYALAAIIIIFFANYLLGGYSFLQGKWGTDINNIISQLAWVDKYFPHVPFWYPLTGGGMSFTHAYPNLSFYIVSLVHHLSGYNLIQSFTLVGYASVLVFALGIYAYVSLRFKNQTAALIAAVFYLASPLAWTWLVNWGFYAESISHIFVLPAIIFWDLFFSRFIKKDFGPSTRFYLLGTVTFVSLAAFTHFAAGFAISGLMYFYVAGYTIKAKGHRKQTFIRGLLALLVVGLFTYGATLSVSYPFRRYAKIVSVADVSSPGATDFESLARSIVKPTVPLGISTFAHDDFLYPMNRFSFPLVVTVFGLVGALLFSWTSSKKLSLGLFAAWSFLVALSPNYYWYISNHIPIWFIMSSFGWRITFIALRAVWPILAGLGVVSLLSLPFFWLKNRTVKFFVGIIVSVSSLAIATLALVLFNNLPPSDKYTSNYGATGFNIGNIWHQPYQFCFTNTADNSQDCITYDEDTCAEERECQEDSACLDRFEKSGKAKWCHSPLAGYFSPLIVEDWCLHASSADIIVDGGTDPRFLSLCNVEQLSAAQAKDLWQLCNRDSSVSSACQLSLKPFLQQLNPQTIPSAMIPASFDPNPDFNNSLAKIAAENPDARIDYSPYAGSLSMVAPYYNLNRNLSQIHAYLANASLVLRYQGLQQTIFYLNDPQFDNPDLVNNLAKWFGINYVFTAPTQYDTDEEPLFKRAGWEIVDGDYNDGLLKFTQPNALLDLSSKPSVLVIGQQRVNAYEQVFTISSMGVFSYDDAFIVWGGDKIDHYSPEELQRFNTIILNGYSYSNKSNANQLLTNYVENGGNIFIDTGWQDVVPDWKTDTPLDIIPFNQLVWSDLGTHPTLSGQDSLYISSPTTSGFGPFRYGEGSWGISTNQISELKSWARPVLLANDKPLIVAGQLGKGKIVWSGMNIFAHAKQGKITYQGEINFLSQLFSWLTVSNNSQSLSASYTRDNPDTIHFIINSPINSGAFLLWKEGFHPDFRATLNGQKLSLYRAGPGWAIMYIPKASAGDTITYQYQQPVSELIAHLISIFTFIMLIAVIIESINDQSIFTRCLNSIEAVANRFSSKKITSPGRWLSKDAEEEEY